MTRTSRVTLASIAACVFGFAGTTRGAGQYLKVDYPASTVAGELQIAVTYTLWIPDGAPRLRRRHHCHQHGAGTTASIEGSTAAYDLHWQALAEEWDCALLGPSFQLLRENNYCLPQGFGTLVRSREEVRKRPSSRCSANSASKSGHPELETVPWVLWEHSRRRYLVGCDVCPSPGPRRRGTDALGFRGDVSQSSRVCPGTQYPTLSTGSPMMCNPGVKEKQVAQEKNTPEQNMKGPWLGNKATFHEYRAEGPPIGFAPDQRTGHECGDEQSCGRPVPRCLPGDPIAGEECNGQNAQARQHETAAFVAP